VAVDAIALIAKNASPGAIVRLSMVMPVMPSGIVPEGLPPVAATSSSIVQRNAMDQPPSAFRISS
jgi:hypothetical protein